MKQNSGEKKNPKTKKKDEESYKFVVGFHSRQTQYEFGQWFLYKCLSHWNNNQSGRVLFQQYLRRLEYKHILEFQVWFLKMAFKGKLPHCIQKQFPEIDLSKKELSVAEEEAIEWVKAQIVLTILYYQAYQVIKEFLFSEEA